MPSYLSRFEIRAAILAALQGRSASTRQGVAALRRNWAINRGAHVLQQTVALHSRQDQGAATSDHSRPEIFHARQFARNKLALSYIRRFLDLADAHGITVFWLLPPLSPEAQAVHDRSEITDYLTRVARMAQAHSRDVIVIDGRHSGYAQGEFADKVHLDRHGAITFSTDVATIVGRYLSHPETVARWNTLPAWRYLEPVAQIEDLKESVTAVESGRARR